MRRKSNGFADTFGRCLACGRMAIRQSHRCPDLVAIENWELLDGSGRVKVECPQTHCCETLRPLGKPTPYGVVFVQCSCGTKKEVRLSGYRKIAMQKAG